MSVDVFVFVVFCSIYCVVLEMCLFFLRSISCLYYGLLVVLFLFCGVWYCLPFLFVASVVLLVFLEKNMICVFLVVCSFVGPVLVCCFVCVCCCFCSLYCVILDMSLFLLWNICCLSYCLFFLLLLFFVGFGLVCLLFVAFLYLLSYRLIWLLLLLFVCAVLSGWKMCLLFLLRILVRVSSCLLIVFVILLLWDMVLFVFCLLLVCTYCFLLWRETICL